MIIARDAALQDVLVSERTQSPTLTIDRPDPGEYHVAIESVDAEGVIGTYEPQIVVVKEPTSEEEKTIPWWLLLIPVIVLL